MPVSDSEEHGVKVEKQSCDFFCMPPKKRHLFRFQSMGTISQSINSPTSGFEQEHIQPAWESEHVLNSQVTPPGETLEGKSSAEVKECLFNNQELVVDTFPDTGQGQTPGVDATASTDFVDYGSADVDVRELDGDNNFQLSSEELNLQPAVNNPDQPSILSSSDYIDHGKTNVNGRELDVANKIQPSSEETDLQSAVEKPDQPSILSTTAFIYHGKADEKGKELDDENNFHQSSEEMELQSEVRNPDQPSIVSTAALIDHGKVDVNGKELEGGNNFQPCHEEMYLQSAVEKPNQPTILRSTTFIDHGKVDVNGKKLDNNFQLSSQEMGLQSAAETPNPPFMLRSISERIPSEKSAFRKVEEKIPSAGSPAFPVQSHNCNGSIVKQEKMGMQSRDLPLHKVPMDVQCKVAEVISAHQHSNRSNWDLNTMMDAWEGPPKQDQGELCSRFLRDADKNIIAIPVGIPFCEHLHPNPHLKLELYPSNVNKSDLQSGMPLRLPLSSSCNSVSDLSLSITTSASGTSNFSPSASVKSEPFNGCWSYIESASQPSLYKAVKPEPHEEAIIKCANLLPKTNPEVGRHVASMLAVKLESKSEGQNCALRQVRTMDEDTSTIPTNEDGADRSKVNADVDLASANEIAGCNDNCSHLVQMSSVCCTQISAISTTSNLEPLPKPQGFEKSELIKSPNSALVGEDSNVANNSVAAEAVSQMDTVMIGSASLNVSPSHITPIVVPSALQQFNAGDKVDAISKLTVPVPSEFKCVYDNASQSIGGASLFDYKQASGSMLPVANGDLLDSSVQAINFDTSTSLSSGDDSLESNVVTHKNEVVPTVDLSSQVLKEGLHVNRNVSGHQSVAVNFQLKPKLHMDEDDDIEDGEVRELHIQRSVSGSSRDNKETDKSCLEQLGSLVTAMTLPSSSLLEGDKGVVETREQRQEEFTEPSLDSNSNSCDRNDGGSITHIQNPTLDLGEDDNLNKNKLVKISRMIPTDRCKEKCNEAKQHSKGSNGSCKALSGGGACEAGSNITGGHGLKVLPSDQSCPSKSGLLVKDNNMQSSSGRSRIVNLAPTSKDSAVTEKSSEKCLPSKIERERSSEKSMHGDRLYRRGIRDVSGNAGVRKFDKESKKEDTLNIKVESDFARSRARNDKQFETFHSEWNADADYASEHFGRPNNYRYLKSRNTSDVAFTGMDGPIESVGRIVRSPPMVDGLGNFSHVSRRRSPAAREQPMNIGMHIIRRPRRDVSPGRCADGVSDMVLVGREERFMQRMAGDVVDPSAVAGARSNFEREETFIQRGRSISPPLLRRGGPRLSRMHSPSSTRHARSPRQWSPQRSLDSFNMRWEAVRGRSPNLQIVRMRSPPSPRDSYIEGVVPGRRCGSPPCIPRLHDDVRDVGPSREFEYARGGAPIQRNVRRLRVIDPRGNDEEFFGIVHPRPRIHDLLEDERFSDRRGAPERHGIIHPPRHQFAEPNEEDIDFQIEHEAPRPVRLRMGEEDEFLDRGRPQGGGIRNRLRELPRRLRGVEEREDGRAWHEADFNDVRMKRRRF